MKRQHSLEEALHYGVVNYKTDAGKVMEKARDIAAKICAASPTAVSSSLEMMNDGANHLDPVQDSDAGFAGFFNHKFGHILKITHG